MSKPKPTAPAVAGRTAIQKHATTEPQTVQPGEAKPSNKASRQTPRASLHDPAESQHISESRNRKRKRGNTSTTSSNQAQARGHSHSQKRPRTKRITLPPHPPRRGAVPPPQPALPPSVLTVIATTTAPSIQQMTGRDSTSANVLHRHQQQQQQAAAAATRLQTLHAAATLLQSLHVRNRNQHRGQPWWKWFSMLRRTVAEVLRLEVRLWGLRFGGEGDLEGMVEEVDAGGSGGGGGGGDGGGGDGERDSGKRVKVGARRVKTAEHRPSSQAEVMRKRLALEEKLAKEKMGAERWLREVVVPKAWVAFTALVGDGQFAGLGVVLIGLVGEVAGLVGGCEEYEEGVNVGVGDNSEAKMVTMRDAVIRDAQPGAARLQGNKSHGPRRPLDHDSAMEDVGEPVQRRRDVRTTTTTTTTALDTALHNAGTTKQERELRGKDTEMPENSADSPGHEPPPSSPFASFHNTLESDAELHNTSMQDEATSRPTAPAKDPRNETAAVSEAEDDGTDHSSHAVVRRKTNTKTREMKKNRTGTTTGDIPKHTVPQGFAQTSSNSNSNSNSKVNVQGKDVKPKAKNEPAADSTAVTKAKAVTKTSKKKKKGNAIDDLFAGFA